MDRLWEHAEGGEAGPVSLYVRGSAARWLAGDATHDPWDLDVVLVTRRESSASDAEFRGLNPPLDLLRITVSDFSSDKQYLPMRLLLQDEGTLVRGLDLVAALPEVDITDELATIAAGRHLAACHFNVSALGDEHMGALDIRRCAKAALRLASPSMMRSLSRFERSPSICAWNLAARFPTLAEDIAFLYATLGVIDAPDRLSVRASLARVLEVVEKDEKQWTA
jgi:hypothetical protein